MDPSQEGVGYQIHKFCLVLTALAATFEKGKLIERPASQEASSKSHDTPIHRS
jgi:hypothetical protein